MRKRREKKLCSKRSVLAPVQRVELELRGEKGLKGVHGSSSMNVIDSILRRRKNAVEPARWETIFVLANVSFVF